MSEFKAGDVVQLKSGGPNMTVERINDDRSLWCVWFEGGKPDYKAFPAVALKPAPSGAPPSAEERERG